MHHEGPESLAPAASGVRLAWTDLPERVRAVVEAWLGSAVVSVVSQPSGFSPGVAVRLQIADGRRVFVKAIGPEPNPESPRMHRREAQIVAALPPDAPVPRLLWAYDEGDDGWVVPIFEDVEGRHPATPWRAGELDRVLEALDALAAALTPSPVPEAIADSITRWGLMNAGFWQRLRDDQPPQLDPWSARNLEPLAAVEAGAAASAGETLLHLDLRADNLLLTDERVLVVDWPHARIGAPWVDLVCFAPSVTMQGGPHPEALLARSSAARAADAGAITAIVAALAGYFTWNALQPAPPGLPTVRAFQDAQGVVARRWLAARTGLA